MVLEGEKLVHDALASGIRISLIYHDRELYHFKHLTADLLSDVKTERVSASDMAIVSKLKSPPGIVAIAEKPSFLTIESKRQTDQVMPVVTVADTFTDAGNLGGLLRSMAASGASSLILSEHSIDAWDVKVTRSGAGAHFLVPIRTFCWDNIRQRMMSAAKVFYAESHHSTDEPAVLYHDVSYFTSSESEAVLFLGSESRGFSDEARKLFKDTSAQKVSIPMSSRFDSLNNYVAGSIILFEMRKQYQQMMNSSKL